MNRRALLAVTGTTVATLAGCSRLARDSEETSTPERTGTPTASEATTDPEATTTEEPGDPDPAWQYGAGARSLRVVGDSVFCTERILEHHGNSDGEVVRLDRETGDPLWQYGRFAAGLVGYTAQTVDGGVYFGRWDDVVRGDGEVYALEPDGTERWVDEDVGSIYHRPRLADGTLYAADDHGRVRAYDADSGEVRWETDDLPSARSMAAGLRGVGEVVYVKSRILYGLDPHDGEVLWSRGDEDARWGVTVRVTGTAAFVYGRDADGVAALAPDGSERWAKDLDATELRVCGDLVVVESSDTGALHAFHAATGEGSWTASNPGYDVVAHGDRRLYGSGANADELHVVDVEDGSTVWSGTVGGAPIDSVRTADGDEAAYVETDSNELHRVDEGGAVGWTGAVGDDVLDLAVGEDDLYVGTDENVYRFDLE